MRIGRQSAERRERARSTIARITARPQGKIYGDYRVVSASGKTYRVAMRGPGLFENYCSCPDFAVNTLGTCKHIEALLLRLRERHGKALAGKKWQRARASLSLNYGDTLAVRLRLPDAPSKGLLNFAESYFDRDGVLRQECFRTFGAVLDHLRRLDEGAVIYSDVLEYIDRENELAEGLDLEAAMVRTLERGNDPLADVLKTKLMPYQARGAIFAACRGRVVLADDMGLGKTVQALAAAELLRRQKGIRTVLVVAPASVKYQWKTEIEKFTELPVQVIEGPMPQRKKLYARPAFYNLANYEQVRMDVEAIQALRPDLIILDEAQRIRNWTTATARTIKQLKSRYAFVLTGTPLENKLEELYSVVQFVDGRRLGPAFRFLQEHRIENEKKRLLGYRGLERIHEQLQPILLRRTRPEVLKELPPRTDQIFRVPMTKQQAGPYEEQKEILGKLVKKWERQGWLSEIDMKRLTCCLQNMRMLCNSTFLFDKETNFSPKLEEFREIVRELVLEEQRKVVVFSEYERMTHLAAEELETMGIGFVSLHGGVPAKKRGALMTRFREDPECRVFLSTDAGGVGLNLQSGSAVINFEPPWNPARLEQRIGRVHRLGQSRPVQVIHFLTEASIEERVWETLRLKKSLFASVFDKPQDEVLFAALGKKSVLEEVQELMAEPPRAVPAVAAPAQTAPPPSAEPAPPASVVQTAAAGFLEAGLKFLEALAPPPERRPADKATGDRLEQAVAGLFQKDPRSQRPVLAIPLPESVTGERLGRALAGLLRAFPGEG
jgi:superfamily II DNA or RNA helicase